MCSVYVDSEDERRDEWRDKEKREEKERWKERICLWDSSVLYCPMATRQMEGVTELILEQVWTKSNLGSFQFFTGYGVCLENGIQYLFSFDFTG